MGYVMTGEVLFKTFDLVNESDLDLDYKINLLSEQTEVVQSMTFDSEIGKNTQFVVGKISVYFYEIYSNATEKM